MLQPISVVQGHWESIGVDFITDLPYSLRGNDGIVTIVDHFPKRAHQLPCVMTIDTVGFAQLFLEAILRLHGVPWEFLSDSNTSFK
jgi:hypothetical protein